MSLASPPSDNHGHPPIAPTLLAEILDLLGRDAAVRRRRRAARTLADRDAAEEERRAVEGEFWAIENQLAELQMQMLRATLMHQREAFADLLADAITEIAIAVAKEAQDGS